MDEFKQNYDTTYIASQPASTFQPVTKREWEFQKHDTLFGILSIPFGFLFMRYIVCKTDGFQTTLIFLLFLLGGICYLHKAGYRQNAKQRILGGILAMFTLVFSITASPILHGLNFVFLMAAIPWYLRAVTIGCNFVTRFLPSDITKPLLIYAWSEFGAASHAMGHSLKKTKSGKNVLIAAGGLLLTIPLTVIVAMLLCSADAGIESIFDNIRHTLARGSAEFFWQTLFGLLIGFWFFGLLYGTTNLKLHPHTSDEEHEDTLAALHIFPNIGLYAGVTPVCLLYLLYVISQTKYFCSAFFGILPDTMESYAEYARRGFFELCAIAVINLFVILILTGCAKKGAAKLSKFYAAALIFFTLFIIATAIAKMCLYIDAYGLTQLRVFTTWFMILLTVIFLVLLVRQFKTLPTAKILASFFMVWFAVLCFSRPDALIAEYNLSRIENGTLTADTETLYDLSDDALCVMLKHQDTMEELDGNSLQMQIDNQVEHYEIFPDESWNFSAWYIKNHASENS